MAFPEGKGVVKEALARPVEGSFVGSAFKTGKAMIATLEDFTKDPESGDVARGEGIQSGLALPLISRNKTLGVMTLASRTEKSFSQDDVDFLVRAAGQVAIAIENALAYREIAELKDKLAQEKLYLEEEIRSTSDFEGIIGQSSALRQALQLAETVATSDSTVLLLGETGTGKELVARAIHERSRRSARTFVELNCAAIPTGLLESELFGHERGAFTGAVSQKIGRLELADQGTLFLDEVGDIPLELQPKLLRVLQDRQFERLGSTRTKKVDIRLIAATNRELDRMIEEKQFRSDLYYRLNVFPIRLPPLRERPEDIPLLLEYLVTRYAQKAGKKFRDITSKTLQLFRAYRWPGNIRELQNVIERAVVLCDGDTFSVDESWLRQESSPASGPIVPLVTTLEDRERQMIEEALAQSSGRISGPAGAAAKLGIPRQTLDRKILSLGIEKNQFKSH